MFSLLWLSAGIPKSCCSGWGRSGFRFLRRRLRERVVAVAGALRKWGIGKGDRVAILSENRPEWTIADFASLLIGAVTVPIYATLTAEQTAYILRDSGARVVFVSSEAQLQKVLSIRGQTALEKTCGHGRCRQCRRGAHGRDGISRPASANAGLEAAFEADAPRGFSRTIWPPLSIPRERPARPRG